MELPNNRAMPVDPELVKTQGHRKSTARAGERILTLVTERGQMWRGIEASVTDLSSEQVEGFIPHWRTCTQTAAHRKKED